MEKHEPGSEPFLIYKSNVFPEDKKKELLEYLKSLQYIKGFNYDGKQLSRDQLWFQMDDKYFCESWIKRYPRWTSNRYSPELLEIQKYVQNYINNMGIDIVINSCLINYYKDGNNCIGPHRDNEQSFGKNPTIIGISLGATRTLVLKHNSDVHREYKVELEDNSMFIMTGTSQSDFLHEIPKDPDCHTERWSLTFRHYVHI